MQGLLTHLRAVQNIQTIMSAVALYVMVSGWHTVRDLHADLSSFQADAQVAARVLQQPVDLYSLIPELPDYRDQVLVDLRSGVRRLYWNVEPILYALPLELLTEFPDLNDPLHEVWSRLAEQRWNVPLRIDLPEIPIRALDEWLYRYRRCSLGLERHLLPRLHASRYALGRIGDYTRPSLTVDINPVLGSLDQATVDLRVSVYSEGVSTRSRCPRGERADAYEYDHVLDITLERKTFSADMPVGYHRTVVDLRSNVLSRYGYIAEYWPQLAALSIEDGLEWAERQLSAGIRGRDIRLMGANFTGDGFAVLIPLGIAGITLYMLVAVTSRNTRLTPVESEVPPWMAGSAALPAVGWTALTLGVLPGTTIGLAIWRLSTAPEAAAVVAGVLQLAAGVVIHYKALSTTGEATRLASWLTR